MKGELTDKQREVLTTYKRNIRKVGPTVRELAKILGQSAANVHQHLTLIRKKGFL